MYKIKYPRGEDKEKNSYVTNVGGKIQKAYKASFPPEEAKEDWLIINELAETMNHRKLFNDKDELDSSLLNQINLFIEKAVPTPFIQYKAPALEKQFCRYSDEYQISFEDIFSLSKSIITLNFLG